MKKIIAILILFSIPVLSGEILVFPKEITVVRGSNTTFDVYVLGDGRNVSISTSDGFLDSQTKFIPLNRVEKFTVVYNSRHNSFGKSSVLLMATDAPPVKVSVTILPNERDKENINKTFWSYVERTNKIRDCISADRNATINGMLDLTNIVTGKLWVIKSRIDNDKCLEAYKLLEDVEPQIKALEDYCGKPSEKGKGKLYVYAIIGASVSVFVVIVFEVLKHLLL